MSELREDVRIITLNGELSGHLFVGEDGLPELRVTSGDYTQTGNYKPATLPAAWELRYVPREEPPILSSCWFSIDRIRRQIQDAQREAEQETPEPEDEITAAKRYKALEEE